MNWLKNVEWLKNERRCLYFVAVGRCCILLATESTMCSKWRDKNAFNMAIRRHGTHLYTLKAVIWMLYLLAQAVNTPTVYPFWKWFCQNCPTLSSREKAWEGVVKYLTNWQYQLVLLPAIDNMTLLINNFLVQTIPLLNRKHTISYQSILVKNIKPIP